jgi:hypothetical protein
VVSRTTTVDRLAAALAAALAAPAFARATARATVDVDLDFDLDFDEAAFSVAAAAESVAAAESRMSTRPSIVPSTSARELAVPPRAVSWSWAREPASAFRSSRARGGAPVYLGTETGRRRAREDEGEAARAWARRPRRPRRRRTEARVE